MRGAMGHVSGYLAGVAGINIHLDTPEHLLKPTMEKFGITEKAVRRAEVRAINRMILWMKSQMARAVAKDIGVVQKHIKRRMFSSRAKRNAVIGRFWFGVGGINPMKLGLKGRKLKTGYKVGRFTFDGGFRAYYRNRWEGSVGGIYHRKGADRLPIKSMDIEVKKAASVAMERLMNRAEVELMKKLRQELNFEMHKAMGTV